MTSYSSYTTLNFPDASSLLAEFQSELTDILNWWMENMVDRQHGGFFGRMDGKGQLFPKADRGVILNTRILWTFSAAARQSGNSQYKSVADHALDYLLHHFWDNLEGGVYWAVDWQGNPVNTQKQIYAQAFAIYAFSEYFLLTNDLSVLDKAIESFWLIEKYSYDKIKGGYYSAFARDWTSMDDIRLSEKDANEAKIMNTHLHLLEAYSNLYRCLPSSSNRTGLENILDLMITRFYKKCDGHLHIYFDEDWNSKSNLISFGHDIEASWLLMEAADLLGNATRDWVKPAALHLAERVMEEGLDKKARNGLRYEILEYGQPVEERHWWPQCEAIIGFWNAWQISGKEEFAKASTDVWDFTKNNLLDKINGEWHWKVDVDGKPLPGEDKAGPWKGPYHNGRLCLEMISRLSD